MAAIDITPETKLGKLLKTYPSLESYLMEMSPAFKKLKNPVLRKTVARVASLRQVAEVGDIPLSELINRLRKKVGIQDEYAETQDEQSSELSRPAWMDQYPIGKTFDARAMIDSGERPLEKVIKELSDIPAGQIYELITPFLPSPLINTVKQKGYRVWSEKIQSKLVKNYFLKL